MICLSITADDYNFCIETVSFYPMVELRLDSGKLTNKQVESVVKAGKTIIATCRAGQIDDSRRLEILLSAINAGTAFIDIDYETDNGIKDEIISAAKGKCKIIASYHNYSKTPPFAELMDILNYINTYGDLLKIACQAENSNDFEIISRLYGNFPKGKLVAFGMGLRALSTRLNSVLHYGAPFIYASLNNESATAEGQIEYKTLEQILKAYNY